MSSIFFHIDMNCYFASVATVLNPSLKGKPVVIGVDHPRGIVSTCNYEAREYGIHSAMPIYQAKEKCDKLIIVDHDFKAYEKFTFMFLEIIKRFSKKIQQASIDECYVDMSDVCKDFDEAYNLASKIQYLILNELGLPCSIGISYNKFLAKMGSDYKKPLGITLFTKDNIHKTLWKLDIGKMYGIGNKSVPRFKELGINTIGDLAKYPDMYTLKVKLGSKIEEYVDIANGNGDCDTIDYSTKIKSISNETTFDKNTNSYEFLEEQFKILTMNVSKRAKDDDMVGNGVEITLKYDNFQRITRSHRLKNYFNDYNTMYRIVSKLLKENYDENKMIRLIGVALLDTKKAKLNAFQLTLFDYDENKSINNDSETDKIIKELNNKIGKDIFKTARSIK